MTTVAFVLGTVRELKMDKTLLWTDWSGTGRAWKERRNRNSRFRVHRNLRWLA
ncbi:hypothetical protein Hanom_Chr04g00357031 [Helianthus anomalus]